MDKNEISENKEILNEETKSSNASSQTMLKGATILAAAALVTKVFGAVFRIPLTNMIGAEGQSYYTVAYNIYTLLFVIATAGIPVAISRMVSSRIAEKDYINAHKSYKLALKVSSVLGCLAFLILFFGAGFIARSYNIPGAEPSIRALSFAMLLTPAQSSFRGYYQGRQEMLPTGLSEVVEQMIRVVVGLSLAYMFYKSSLEMAAAGATFGASAGVTAALIVMIIIYLRDKSKRSALMADSIERAEDDSSRLKELLAYLIPVTIGAAVLPIMFNIDSAMVVRRLMATGWDRVTAQKLFGLMGGYCDPIINLPSVFTDAICISLMPAITTAYTLKNKDELNKQLRTGLKTMMIIAYPCTIGLMVLARPILTMLFFKQHDEALMAVPTLQILSLLIVMGAIMRTFATSLQGIGHMMLPVRNLFIGVLIKAVVSYLLLGVYSININGAPIGTVIAHITAAILNYLSLRKYVDVEIDVKTVFWKPLLSALIMGAATIAVYKLIFMALGSNTVATFAAIMAAVIVYFVTLFKTKAMTKEEVELVPKGDVIYRLAVKLKIAE